MIGGVGRFSLVEIVALLAVAGAAGAAATAWRAARQARRAAEASAEWARGLHEGLRRAIHDSRAAREIVEKVDEFFLQPA